MKQNYKFWQLPKEQLEMMVKSKEISNDKKWLSIATLEERFKNHYMSLYKDDKKALKLAIAKCSLYYEEDNKK